mgnify:CR=1 FL=1
MITQFWEQVIKIAELLKEDHKDMRDMVYALGKLQRNKGRLFILGVGGSAANASHAVNDFRKLCEIEAYTPTDNIAELTARTNDEGWETVFVEWLKVSQLKSEDAILVLSVGGGSEEKKVSMNIVRALDYAKSVGSKIFGIVGRDGGYTKQIADICVVIPTVNDYLITPFVESFQALIWHMLVFHPDLKTNEGKWESLK